MRCLVRYAAAATLLLACTENGALPTDQTSVLDPGAQPSTRAQLIRTDVGIAFGGDPSSPFVVMAGYDVGVTPAQLCATGTAPNHPNSSALIVLPPSGAFLAGASGGRDVPVLVFQYGGGIVTSHCDYAAAPLVAAGTGKFHFSLLASRSGNVVQHYTVQGILQLVTGGEARLLATARVHERSDGTLLFDVEQIRLTPL